jgi:cold shock CspA family protein
MPIGKIVSWNSARGFGFIGERRADGAADIFVHCRDLADRSRDQLPVGIRVSFEIGPPDRSGKQRAFNVAALGHVVASLPSPRPSPREAAQALFRE